MIAMAGTQTCRFGDFRAVLQGLVAYVGEHRDAVPLAERFLEQIRRDNLCPQDSVDDALKGITEAVLSGEVRAFNPRPCISIREV